jgi:hypothetical protein
VGGWGGGAQRERERDGETEREMGRECGRGTRRWASRLSPLSLCAQKTDTGGSRLFHSPFSFTYCPPGRGTSLGGGSGRLAGCGKDGKEEKERECEREPVPKTG